MSVTTIIFQGVGSLRDEIKQAGPWSSREQEAFLNLLRTADALARGELPLLKNANLSPNQYNALRILRGAGADGVSCSELGNRLIERDPDVTRLIDKLEERGLMARTRDARDRRVYRNVITQPDSTCWLRSMRRSWRFTGSRWGTLSHEKLTPLIRLLEEARTIPE